MTRKQYEQARKELTSIAVSLNKEAQTVLLAMLMNASTGAGKEQVEYIADVNEG